jgi:MFS family permease
MSGRWRVLMLLFLARCAMAAQFESIGALGPLLKAEGIDLSQLGLLIGLYLAPGVLFALPGGIVIQRIGEKKTLLLCLLLMTIGGMFALDTDWRAQIFARLVSGSGGVILTVAATKMIVDLFSGRELATAMAVFVNSWPIGIAVALVTLPFVGETSGLYQAGLLTLAFPTAACLAVAAFLPAPQLTNSLTLRSIPSSWQSLGAVSIAGAIWGIANAAFATLFSFGPTLLAERGLSASGAASLISVVLWVTIFAIPVGGLIAERFMRINSIIVACVVLAAILTTLVARIDGTLALLISIGVISGLPGAAVMSLPSRALDVQTRAVGMGIFYTVYYGIMLLFPVLQGAFAKNGQSAAIAFDAAAILLLCILPLLAAFTVLVRRISRAHAIPA